MPTPKPLLAAVALLIVLATQDLPAQETLPAPEPAPSREPAPARRPLRGPDGAVDRAQRRERLRNLSGQVLDAIAPQPGAAPAAQLDIPKLNGGLQSILDALLAGDTAIESLRMAFDPARTNLAEDRAAITATAALRHTAWSQQPSRLTASLAARVEQSAAAPPVALLDGQIELATQTLPLANYALAKYKEQISAAPADDSAAAPSDPFRAQLDARLMQVERINSMDELADLFTTISGLRLTSASQRIEDLQTALRQATDDGQRKQLEADLKQARLDRDKLFDVRPRIERDKQGRVRAVTLDMAGSELFPGAQVQKMVVSVTETELHADVSATMTRYVELYSVVKPLAMSTLQRLQSGDPQALAGLRALITIPFARGRQMVVGDEPRAQ